MKIAEMAFNSFPSDVRSRGRVFFDQGNVDLLVNTKDLIEGFVYEYRDVFASLEMKSINRRKLAFIPHCECMTFQQAGVCPHLWAIILAADNSPVLNINKDAIALSKNISSPSAVTNRTKKTHPAKARIEEKEKAPWELMLASLSAGRAHPSFDPSKHSNQVTPRQSELRFTIQTQDLYSFDSIPLSCEYRIKRINGDWGIWKEVSVSAINKDLVDPDYSLALKVYGIGRAENRHYYSGALLSEKSALTILPDLCASKILYVADKGKIYGPVDWDASPAPWKPELVLSNNEKGYLLTMQLKSGDQTASIEEPVRLTASGWIFWADKISRLDIAACPFEWVVRFRDKNRLLIPANDIDEFIDQFGRQNSSPALCIPRELNYTESSPAPKPILEIGKMTDFYGGSFPAKLSFDYADNIISSDEFKPSFIDAAAKTIIRRNLDVESACLNQLTDMGARNSSVIYGSAWKYEIKRKDFLKVVESLSKQGWEIRAQKALIKHAGDFSVNVSSGIDWFELKVTCDFEGQSVSMPALLKALKNKDGWIQLGDGNLGIIPGEWLNKYGQIATTAEVLDDGSLRFKKNQAFLLDAWLEQQENVNLDDMFKKVHKELESFNSISPVTPPSSFKGTLREYQSEGLGWLIFLNKMGFGGCLADDMGLGKTVQVLALLALIKNQHDESGTAHIPSIVVVPQSVVFNWIREAETFTPDLKVLNFTGSERVKDVSAFNDLDLIITTYGILLRDIEWLKDHRFNYAILDESQAIKNSATQTAKATRLLQSDHRLAMSGTPIENHLGELWSLFEFLNPGLLGASSTFDSKWARNPEPEIRATISRAVRPFILRRTKSQVAKDLPDRQEETLYCELPPKDRKAYDDLREHYRSMLLNKVNQQGINKSKIVILEALLRLRQAACHPKLLDKKAPNTCAKFEALLPQLEELAEEGHKALVFSQFTSYLALLKPLLTKQKIEFEYLDGQTKNRQECVDRFQNDPDCRLFLISLKAGGLGLNLTSAEYVFLLDPWWNPAVEAQAIDRAHRIGQINKVFAYRLIAKDTVEERILELQAHKRKIANDILSEDNAILRGITREDIEFIFA